MSEVTLYLGDCLEIMRGMEAGSVDAIITDLPYGTTACSWDEVIPFAPMWEVVKHVLKPRGVFVTTASQPFTSRLINSNLQWFRYEWIWVKGAPVGFLNARRQPLKDHENIVVFSELSHTYNPQGLIETKVKSSRKNGKTKTGGVYGEVKDREYWAQVGNFPRSVLGIKRITQNQIHPTQKPVALYEYLIRTYTNEGETVLDMCAGSGTTGVAAVQTGRNFIGIELRPDYYEIMERRIREAQAQPSLLSP